MRGVPPAGRGRIMRMPIKITRTRKCRRCSLRYPRANPSCSHCTGLSDVEVDRLKQRHKREQAANAQLGRLLYLVAVVLVAGMLALTVISGQ